MRPEPAPNALLARLRAVLEDAGFAGDDLRGRLGPPPGLGARASLEVYARRLAGADRGGTLARLLALTLPVGAQAAEAALAPLRLDELVDAGLLARDGELARALVRIEPFDGLLIASDPEPAGERALDFVLGVNPAARLLARLTLRRPVGAALDLGTGCGLQALLAARHAAAVTATDVNPRALEFARLNARLNAVDPVELLEGSWLEPVAGRRFDLIVANPPYVVSPDAAYLFRDAGLVGNAVSRRLVERLPSHLAEGGVAQLVCTWAHRSGEHWRAQLESWVEGLGVDALLLRYETLDPVEYALGWNRELGDDPAAFTAALDRWLAYDARLGIERLSWGMLVLRRRDAARTRVRAIAVPGSPRPGAGAQLERVLDAWDAPLDDAALADAVLRPVEGARLDRRLVFGAAGWAPARGRAQVESTIGFAVPLEDEAVAVVARLDGETPVRDAVGQAAAAEAVDAPALAERVLPALRRLYDLGCLTVGSRS